MRRIKKVILSLCLVVAMVMGEAGGVLAAEPRQTADDTEISTDADYEIRDPQLDKADVASVDAFNVEYYKWNSCIKISFSGKGSKFKIYVNEKLFETIENKYIQANSANPAPIMYYTNVDFKDIIQGGSYTIKIVPCSYSESGDVVGTPSESQTVTLERKNISNLQVNITELDDATGYKRTRTTVSWTVDSGSYGDYGNYEIWRREGKGIWKQIGTSSSYIYVDDSAIPGKKYQYRVRSIGGKNAYVNVPAGKWLTSEYVKAAVADVYFFLDYSDYITIDIVASYSGGVVSGYEIWRSTKRTKGYKKIATIANDTYTDKKVKSGTYYYKVRAYYYDANTGKKIYGAFSDVRPIKLILGDMDVTVKQTGKGTATLEWNKVAGAQKYEVWYKSDLSGDAWKLYKTTTGVNCKVSKLSNDTYYYFRVKAIKGTGSNTYEVSRSVGYLIGFQSPSPEIVKRKITASKLKDKVTIKSTIKWDRIYGAKKIRIVGVKYSHYENGFYVPQKEKVLKTLKGTATSYTFTTTVTSEDRGYDYIKVVAVKGKEERSGSLYGHRYLNEAKKVTIKRTGDTSATISWQAVPGAASYRVYRSYPYRRSMYYYCGYTDGTTFVDTDLVPGVDYVYYICANNSKLGITSPYGDGKVTYYHKFGAGTITSAKNTAAKKATITWNKVAYAKKYVVYRSTSKKGKYTKVATTSNTTFTDSKVLKGKTYYYKIKAIGKNEAGITLTSSFSGIKAVKITK